MSIVDVTKYVSDDIEVIGLLFSADYCPSCHKFVPQLVEVYEHLRDYKIEIVFVASDKTKEAFEKYLQHHRRWNHVEYDDPIRSQLRQTYEIKTIPALLFFRRDGTLVERQGRNLVVDALGSTDTQYDAAKMIATRIGAIEYFFDSQDSNF